MRKAYRKRRRPLETAAFRAGLALIPRLPRPAVLAVARIAGNAGFLFNRRDRLIGLANLETAYGEDLPVREKRRILRDSMVTMARTFLDVIWFSSDSARRLEKYVELDESMQQLFCNRNQICITAHFGNWEAVGQVMALRGFPFHSIAMPVKNPDVNRLLIERREITGQKIIPREGAVRKLLGVLRNGGKTAFLVDQNTKLSEGGILADYFGLPVPVTPAPAALAAKTGTEILIGFCRPLPGGRYRVYITETIRPPSESGDEAIRQLTQTILTAIESEVRRHPEFWLWTYKRWNRKFPSAHASRYPFYARST